MENKEYIDDNDGKDFVDATTRLVSWLAYSLEDIRFLSPNTCLAGKESSQYTLSKENKDNTNLLLLKCKDDECANTIQKLLARVSRLRITLALEDVNEILDECLNEKPNSHAQSILLDIRKDFYNKQGYFQNLENSNDKPKPGEQQNEK